MNKDELLLQKRLCESSRLAYDRGIVIFSDFLGLNELNILHTTPKNQLPAMYETFGGYDLSERQIVAFLPDALYYEYEYPIDMLEIAPLNPKFMEDLNHRDYLGALMNIGIERSKMGDIMIQEKKALFFIKEELASYVTEQLTRIRHTSVQVLKQDYSVASYEPSMEELHGNVASVRLDSVLSVAWPMSRSKITAYIEGGKVFVNGKLIINNGYRLKELDIISLRGMGRVSYQGIQSKTKKGRYMIRIYKYI